MGMLRAGPDGLCLPQCFSTSFYANKFLDIMSEVHDGVKVSALLTRFLNQHFGGLSDGAEMEGAQMWCQTLIAYLKGKTFIEEMPSSMDGVVVEIWKEEALRRSLWWKDIDRESGWKRPLD